MGYEPRPIDTSGITLSEDIIRLGELLARHTHEIWARQRLSENWHHGPERDDLKKEHPCLVPYDELPESEKKYDRNTSTETLKALIVLGYEIRKR